MSNKDFSENIHHYEFKPNYYVVNFNDIIQKTHSSMSVAEQKLLISLIRLIKPYQKDLTVTFNSKKYMKMLGISLTSAHSNYVFQILSNLCDRWFFAQRPNGTYETWRWLDKIVASSKAKSEKEFKVTFHPELKSYLPNPNLKYEIISELSAIMLMKNRYSPQLYEIFRSNQSQQPIRKKGLNYGINELKESLRLVDKSKHFPYKPLKNMNGHLIFQYNRFSSFSRRVLRPARREINQLTKYSISFYKITTGQTVTGINVVMRPKTKAELQKRQAVIYRITHGISKSQWENMIKKNKFP